MIRDLGAPGDLGWVVMAHGEQYAAEFGWDASFEALVARIVADYAADHDPAREGAWIAERAGRRVGCVFCVRSRPPTTRPPSCASCWSRPRAAAWGWGGELVDRTVAFARAAGYRRLVLWTNEPLAAARRIYLERGFRLVDEERHRSFGAELVGQNYVLAL